MAARKQRTEPELANSSVIKLPIVNFRPGEHRWILLQSDHHIDDPDTQIPLIKKELEWARERGARILMNGDVLSMIGPKDVRFMPSLKRNDVATFDAWVTATVDLAVELFAPYADLIHLVGVGNHEWAFLKHHGVDVVRLLIDRLQEIAPKGHRVRHGGAFGGVVIPFRYTSGAGSTAVRLWRHHGAGGHAPITKGMLDLNRTATIVGDCDILWLGHKHHRVYEPTAQVRISHMKESLTVRKQLRVQTGAYGAWDTGQFDARGNYRYNWARQKAFPPADSGGAKVEFSMHKSGDGAIWVSAEVSM